MVDVQVVKFEELLIFNSCLRKSDFYSFLESSLCLLHQFLQLHKNGERSKDLVVFSIFNLIYLFVCLFGEFFEELGTLGFLQGKGNIFTRQNVLPCVKAPIWCGRVYY
jgi:hypothetical protein